MSSLIPQKEFLVKYNIPSDKFEETTLKWTDLEKISDDYKNEIPNLESSAVYLFNSLMKIPGVHSVRYRVKDVEHVIEKIVRKRIKTPEKIIDITNYKTELTDLIGLRALHLFKEDWKPIHDIISQTWDLEGRAVANYRKGDSDSTLELFLQNGCEKNEHKFGYRSVHYIIKTQPAKILYFAEIQVRTIFEEAWSEIDHTIRYPYDQDNIIFGQFLMILNRLAGSADEMGTFVKFLKTELNSKESNYRQAIEEKDNVIANLENKIRTLNINQDDTEYLTKGLEQLKKSESYFTTQIKPGTDWANFLKHSATTSKFTSALSSSGLEAIAKANAASFKIVDKSLVSNFALNNIIKLVDSPAVKLANGIAATAELAKKSVNRSSVKTNKSKSRASTKRSENKNGIIASNL